MSETKRIEALENKVNSLEKQIKTLKRGKYLKIFLEIAWMFIIIFVIILLFDFIEKVVTSSQISQLFMILLKGVG